MCFVFDKAACCSIQALLVVGLVGFFDQWGRKPDACRVENTWFKSYLFDKLDDILDVRLFATMHRKRLMCWCHPPQHTSSHSMAA